MKLLAKGICGNARLVNIFPAAATPSVTKSIKDSSSRPRRWGGELSLSSFTLGPSFVWKWKRGFQLREASPWLPRL